MVKKPTIEQQLNELYGRIAALENINHEQRLRIDYLEEVVECNNSAVNALLCMGKKIMAQYTKILKL